MTTGKTEQRNLKQRAVCPLCVRVVPKDTKEEAEDVVESHNDARHDGEEVAEVVGPFQEDLNEFMDRVKERHGSDVHGELGKHIVKTDAWDVLDE